MTNWNFTSEAFESLANTTNTRVLPPAELDEE